MEPKTDTITIDSDNEDDTPSTSTHQKAMMKIISVTSAAGAAPAAPKREVLENQADIDVAAFSSTILASLLEVDISEGSADPKSVSPGQKKQPRKKTTNKPNPALLQLERQRMEELKRSDVKLKKKCVVKLRRAEDEFEVARQWVERGRKQMSVEKNYSDAQGEAAAAPSKKVIDTASQESGNPIKVPAKAPSETKDDQQAMETESDSSVVKVQEKATTSKDKTTEESELKESGKQLDAEAKNKYKGVMKEKIGEMLKAAIKAKISQKGKTLDKVRTEEKQKTETKEITPEPDKAIETVDLVDKEKETDLEKVPAEEKEKDKEAESEKVSEQEKAKETEKEHPSEEPQTVEEDKKSEKSEKISETVDPEPGEVIGEESEKVPEQVPAEEIEKDQEQSDKERAKDENVSEKIPESDQADKTETEAVTTETISDELPPEVESEAAAALLDSETIPEEDNIAPAEDLLQNEELIEQEAAKLVEAMDTSNDNGEPSAAELVESMDGIELDEPPKELLDCAIDEVIAMDGIELSDATEELMKALASPSALTSENATDLDPDELIENLPLETTEPPELLLSGETEKSSSGENGDTGQEATSLEDAPATGQILG